MMMAGGMMVTEDTPPDMLAGSMDLAVMLPEGHSLKMSVERSTPMMDLLVQITTANKMSPAGYILKPHNERGPLPYKPSTPIGALDAWTIHVVPKQLSQCPVIKKPLKVLNQPFEQTFRLQVHLPRNQLFVARVSPKTRLSDILVQVCSEKNLDPRKYSLRHPSNLDQVLSLHYTLGDYKLQELTLVCNKTHPVEVSSVDIMSLQRESANPAYRNTKCEGSVSSGSLEGRSLSPVPSDESSASPPPLTLPPSRPIRKRRPAPKPPTITQKPVISVTTQLTNKEKQVNGIQPPTVINHSRNSSDSSGYHEASVLSESPQNNSVPESGKVVEAPLTATLSQSMTDVSAVQPRPLTQSTSCNSISSLSSATGSATGRKKKSAPPPPPVVREGITSVRSPSVSSTASSTTTLDGNEANATVKSATLPPSTRLNTTIIPPPPMKPPPTPPVAVEPPTIPRESDADLRLADEEIDRIFSKATENHSSPDEEEGTPLMSLPSPVIGLEAQNTSSEDQDWEYRLPAPPTFRDDTKSPSVTEFGTVTIGNLSDVVRSMTVTEQHNDSKKNDDVEVKNLVKNVPRVNDNDELMSRPLRKEIRSSSASSIYETEAIKSSRNSIHSVEQVINELSSTLPHRVRVNLNDIETKQSVDLSSRNTLDNFTITTYKDTKPVEVFEDDSIKSSVGEKRDKSKDDAVFRAPKPRVKEPNLSRTSSFSIENNPNGPVIKRSVSYVSLLAANMPRHSQPYRAHLQRHRSSVGAELDTYPSLRKTSSEVNIDKQDRGKENLWNDDTTQLQSVQVLRNILSRSHANLSSSVEEPEDVTHLEQRDTPTPETDATEKNSTSSWERTQSEDVGDTWKPSKTTIEHSASLGDEPSKPSYVSRGPPSINLSTWSERPKRQVSIKNDGEYISGFGKKPISQDVSSIAEKKEESTPVVKALVVNRSPPKNQFGNSLSNVNYKLDEKSKSISDLSRIPIVRSVELKKPFVGHGFDQTRLRHVEVQDNVHKNSISEDISKPSSDEGFIGVNSLARRFGVPQKRPVSEYLGNFKYSDFQSGIDSPPRSKELQNGSVVASVSCTVGNTANESSHFTSRSNALSETNSTNNAKAQSKIRSGGFTENSGLKRTVSQPSHINSLTFRGTGYSKVVNDAKPSNISSVSISSSDQKFPTSSIYIKQSQTLDRKFPINLQPVVKGFKVPSDINSNTSQPVISSTAKDVSVKTLNQNFTVHKVLYNRAASTTSPPLQSTDVKETVRDHPVNNVRLRSSSSSSVTQAKADVTNPVPPPPPMMPVLKPVGQRKGVNFLPPPTADPRDQLMASIRSFGKDSLKKVSNATKSSDQN